MHLYVHSLWQFGQYKYWSWAKLTGDFDLGVGLE